MKESYLKDLEKIIADETSVILDVRESDEYLLGHIPGAISLPLSSLAENLASLSKEHSYHVICKAGVRSAQACLYLEEQGYQVSNLIEGMVAYTGSLEID